MLQNKVIIITGSTTGIGAAIAKECYAQGAKLMIHGRNEARAQQLVNELGDNAAYCIFDLSEPGAVAKVAEHTLETCGAIDGLINNAGIFPRNNIETITKEEYDRIFSVNVTSPLFLTQAVVAMMKDRKVKGSIVNIGSINAHCGQSDLLGYAMSKGTLMTMTQNLAHALSQSGIRVNQLNVGWTLTETEKQIKQQEGLPDDWEDNVSKLFAPRGHILRPEEIAKHAAFWISDASKPVSGAVYNVEQYPTNRVLINEIVN